MSLNELVNRKLVFEFEGFYGLKDCAVSAEKRLWGNQRARDVMKIAEKKAAFIGRFPFVKGVFISGSLSKGVFLEDGDVDFFIVTQPNRLWVARTLLVFYKKVFLLNSRKYFCVNYFVDSDHLKIDEENLFTATEIITLIPMVNPDLYQDFIMENNWVNEFYPEAGLLDTNRTQGLKKKGLGRGIERLLKGKFGESLDAKFMRITLRRWQRKFGHFSEEEFELVMKTNRRVSKHHPSNFQKRVLDKYNEKLKHFEHLI